MPRRQWTYQSTQGIASPLLSTIGFGPAHSLIFFGPHDDFQKLESDVTTFNVRGVHIF